jgi:hypothetical protein
MRTNFLTLIISFIVFSTSFNCKSQTSTNDNIAKFKIDAPPNMRAKENKFISTDYQFSLKTIYVMEGSNTGLEIEFQQKENEKNTLSLFFKLPSGNTFKVYTKNSGFEYNIPKVPCTITNDDFKDIKSARVNQTLYAYIYILRNIRTAKDQSNVESVYFEIFSIDIKEFNINGDKITFSCNFSGELSEKQREVQDTDYKISGEFNIKDFEIGVMMVDD